MFCNHSRTFEARFEPVTPHHPPIYLPRSFISHSILPVLDTALHRTFTHSHTRRISQDNRRARAEHDRDEARTEAARQRKACAAATDRAADAEKTQTALRAAVEGLELELVAAYSQVRAKGGAVGRGECFILCFRCFGVACVCFGFYITPV